ncbi:ATP-binding protein [Microbacterium sp. p3-SID336]|uniref:sensor histidine kinase n=1 Tax=Microbacterium sp. p3-SID336 TaxID=2916212 RepID=UPI0021A80D78|nr:ATP-binding protein [Microbacterium sp. p3-SID336]MCT1476980.1 ATP-binding protein [Microbacterium sp. p3-SID336]
MAQTSPVRSAASRVFVVLLVAVVVTAALVALFLVVEAQRAARDEAERLTGAAAATLAASPEVVDALSAGDEAEASRALEPYALEVIDRAGLDFVTVMTPDGTRITHPDPAQIGAPYLGTVPATPQPLTEEFRGTLGPSVRTIAPVIDDHDALVGWVAAGVTTESIAQTFVRRLPLSLGIAAALVLLGVGGAVIARRVTRRFAGDLPPGQLRDAVSSYESIRTLGEALRAQTHEHGNRLHTAVALLELGRHDEAIEILTETSRQSQSLVDQVTARRHGDPAVGALLLGKASQAKERGIDWHVDIEPATPRTPLSPVDAVSVLGNLIDNALDAAAEVEDRWVRVLLRPGGDGGIVLEVSDSGRGVPEALREQIFAQGYSTKAADPHGRGVGLALVRSVVVEAGGSVTVTGPPTTFRVVLPPAPRRRGRA